MGLNRALKTRFLVATIAERLSFGSSTAAKSDLRSPAQAIGVTFLVYHVNHTVDQ